MAACSGTESAKELEPIEVAVVVPLTGSGAMLDAVRALTLVQESVNEAGGIGGRPLVVRAFDTPLNSPDDLTPVIVGFSEIADQGLKYIISLIAGETVEPIMDVAMRKGVLAMSLVAEEHSNNLPEYNGMLLRAVLPFDRLVQQQAQVLQQRGERSLLVIGPSDDQGAVDIRHAAMLVAFEGCADCRSRSISYPRSADPYLYDWASLGERAAQEMPDAVYLVGTNYQALMDSVYVLDSRGYEGLYYFAYGGFITGLIPIFWDTAAPNFRAFELGVPETSVLNAFRAVYAERFDTDFVPEPRLLAAADYLGLLSLALTEVGPDDPREVSLAMKRLSGPQGVKVGPLDFLNATQSLNSSSVFDYVGLSGPLDFNDMGDVKQSLVVEYGVTGDGQLMRR